MTEADWELFFATNPHSKLGQREPCTDAELEQAEERFGIGLPPSVRAFLKVTNGLEGASRSVPILRAAKAFQIFGKEHREWATAYQSQPRIEEFDKEYFDYRTVDVVEFDPKHLKAGICISEMGDDAVVLLNPMVIWPDGEWETWLLANWLPGAMRFRSFAEWMRFSQADLLGERFEHRDNGDERPCIYIDPPGKPIRRMRPPPKIHVLSKLTRSLASTDEFVRRKAVKQLGTIRTIEAMHLLIDALKSDPSGYVQWEAAESLGKLGFSEAINALIEASQDLMQNNSSAMVALVKLKNERGLQHVLEVVRIGGEHAGVAAHQLAQRGDERLIEAVEELLSAVTPAGAQYGQIYAETVGMMGTERSREVLSALLNNAAPSVRIRGVHGLGVLAQAAKGRAIKEKAIAALRESLAREVDEEVRKALEFQVEWMIGGSKSVDESRLKSPFE